jgi:hypothetical protein
VSFELTIHADIDALRQRLAKAEADRDTWGSARHQENYLQACSMVDALTLQLDELQRTARRIRDGG